VLFRSVAGVAFSIVLLTCPCRSQAAEDQKAEPGKQQPQQLDRTIKVKLGYLLYLPKDYTQKDSWPLLLFLHGGGPWGDDLAQVKSCGPPKLIAAGKEFPFIVVSPLSPRQRGGWQAHELSALLDEIVEKYKVDKERIYVTGLSMGGFGTWNLAHFSPDRFAALVPICSGSDPSRVSRLSHIAVWVFQGAKDPIVPLESVEKTVEALKKAKGNVKFTVYPEAGHDSWTETYNNPELYKWLLQQKRTPRQAEGKKK
jgi:predicted peptidase